MNRQYIGARYVPKVFNNNGSNEWVSGIAYEPLTIVTYLENSYTSVKPVPSNAGAPNIATGYWACTGNVAGIVSELTQEVESLAHDVDVVEESLTTLETSMDNKIKNLKGLDFKFWFIGDSFLTITPNFATIIDGWFSTTSHVTAEGGAGFNHAGNVTGKTIPQLVADDTEVPNDITDVFLYAGCNDCDSTDYDVKTALATTLANIKTKAPNARIWVSCNATNLHVVNEYVGKVYKNINYNCGTGLGQRFIKAPWYCIQDRSLLVDGVHPTNNGYYAIAKSFLNHVFGGGELSQPIETEVSGIIFETCGSEDISARTEFGKTIYSGTGINIATNTFTNLTNDYGCPWSPKVNGQLGMIVYGRANVGGNLSFLPFIMDVDKLGKVRIMSPAEALTGVTEIMAVGMTTMKTSMIANV